MLFTLTKQSCEIDQLIHRSTRDYANSILLEGIGIKKVESDSFQLHFTASLQYKLQNNLPIVPSSVSDFRKLQKDICELVRTIVVDRSRRYFPIVAPTINIANCFTEAKQQTRGPDKPPLNSCQTPRQPLRVRFDASLR